MLILIRGAGDIASGIAFRLHSAGMQIVMTDIEHPTAVRRTVCFSEALRKKEEIEVEGIRACPAFSAAEALEIAESGRIAVLGDPECLCREAIGPDALVDAILAKRNLGTKITDAPAVIGVGPGFTAGTDCHAVIETKRGHTLGRALYTGSAIPNTGVPGNIGGYTTERVLRAPADGVMHPVREIGEHVEAGDIVAWVVPAENAGGTKITPDSEGTYMAKSDCPESPKAAQGPKGIPLKASISGVLRGLLPEDTPVTKDMKSGDIDPRDIREHCFTVSDKALAVGGGVLEAILHLQSLKS